MEKPDTATTSRFDDSFIIRTIRDFFIGLLLILGVLWRSRREGHYGAEKHTGVEMAEIYWHFVDVVWIILFSLIYLLTLI